MYKETLILIFVFFFSYIAGVLDTRMGASSNDIRIALYDEDDNLLGTMKRKTVPTLHEKIMMDCGYNLEIINITHQWENPDIIQLGTKKIKEVN